MTNRQGIVSLSPKAIVAVFAAWLTITASLYLILSDNGTTATTPQFVMDDKIDSVSLYGAAERAAITGFLPITAKHDRQSGDNLLRRTAKEKRAACAKHINRLGKEELDLTKSVLAKSAASKDHERPKTPVLRKTAKEKLKAFAQSLHGEGGRGMGQSATEFTYSPFTTRKG